MTNDRSPRFQAGILLAGAALLGGLWGCASGGADSKSPQASAKGAPQLWAETCARCHHGRPPGEFSDLQWEVIGQHMRIRANLTADETRQIVLFLKASN
ncbi:MAG TPA: cytochrome c [Planctomycetota bacterium]|nr:cytochrome c [Planctomycetota bacterium]